MPARLRQCTPGQARVRWIMVFWPALLSCAAGRGGPDAPSQTSERDPEYAWVVFGADSIRADVARTEAERERGLMFRETIPEGTGMLFVFSEPAVQGVWMRDTLVPLDAAFIDEERTVVNIEPLEPRDETVKYSAAPVLFVLEAPRGWFAEHGVEPGDTAVISFGGGQEPVDPPA